MREMFLSGLTLLFAVLAAALCWAEPRPEAVQRYRAFLGRAVKQADQRAEFLSQFPATCIVKFTANWCVPCRVSNRTIVPALERSGWPVKEVYHEKGAEPFKLMGVERVPTWIIVLDGKEFGRYVGSDRDELQAEIVRANKAYAKRQSHGGE